MPESRRPYPSDLSDADWALLAPLLPAQKPTGRPWTWADRLVADAVFYVLRSGCAWRMLPREFPPPSTVFTRLRRWCLDGTLRRAHDVLRALVRRRAGRFGEPTAAVTGSQSTKTTGVGGPARGCDGGKRVKGRKRHVPVDVTGRVLAVRVHAADVQDRHGARQLVEATPAAFGAVQIVWADQGYTGAFAEWLHETRGTRPEVVRHPARQACRHGLEDRPKHAFEVLPRRWVVERTFARRLPCIAGRPARLGQSRRFSKDYERLPATSEAVIYGAGGAASCSGASRASDPAWRGHVAAAPGALS